MTTLQPIAVALKYGFLAVLYLFMLWVVRSAMRDLRLRRPGALAAAPAPDATGLHPASAVHAYDIGRQAPRLVVQQAPGHDPGMIYDLDGEVIMGRGEQAAIRLEDPFASAAHTRIFPQGGILAVEDLGSTNGTYLNEELLDSPRPLHPGDRLRIGESEFSFETG